jgi:hypothetical protein
MTALARLVSIATPDPTAPLIPEGLIPNLPRYEQFAREHWRLDTGDARSLIGLRNGGVLTQAAGAVPVTFPAGYARIPGGGANGLLTPYPDADDDAWFIVTRFSALNASGTYILGNNTGTSSAGGEQLYITNFRRPALQVRGYSADASIPNAADAPGETNWGFYGFVKTAGTRTLYVGKGGVLLKATSSGTKTAANPARNVAVGIYHRSTAGFVEASQDVYDVMNFAPGVLIKNGVPDDEAVLGIYRRSIDRAAAYGNTVV